MAVGVFFDGFSSTAEMLEVCREAELAGASSLWFAQHMGYREAVVSATAAASVTQSATLVPVAISPYLWTPLPVAMALSRTRLLPSAPPLVKTMFATFAPI